MLYNSNRIDGILIGNHLDIHVADLAEAGAFQRLGTVRHIRRGGGSSRFRFGSFFRFGSLFRLGGLFRCRSILRPLCLGCRRGSGRLGQGIGNRRADRVACQGRPGYAVNRRTLGRHNLRGQLFRRSTADLRRLTRGVEHDLGDRILVNRHADLHGAHTGCFRRIGPGHIIAACRCCRSGSSLGQGIGNRRADRIACQGRPGYAVNRRTLGRHNLRGQLFRRSTADLRRLTRGVEHDLGDRILVNRHADLHGAHTGRFCRIGPGHVGPACRCSRGGCRLRSLFLFRCRGRRHIAEGGRINPAGFKGRRNRRAYRLGGDRSAADSVKIKTLRLHNRIGNRIDGKGTDALRLFMRQDLDAIKRRRAGSNLDLDGAVSALNGSCQKLTVFRHAENLALVRPDVTDNQNDHQNSRNDHGDQIRCPVSLHAFLPLQTIGRNINA